MCKSAKAAETRAADKAIDDGIFCARTVHEIYTGRKGEEQLPVTVLTDSKSLLDSLDSSKQVDEKLIRPLVQFMKDAIASNWVSEMRWVDTNLCMADMMTKAGTKIEEKVMEVLRTGNMFNTREKTGE